MNSARTVIGGLGNLMFKQARLYAEMKDGLIPDVYCQDPKYFEKYGDEIKQMFGEGIGFLPYVAVHVRRGDYLKSGFHTSLSDTDYYDKAIALFPNKRFLVFCGDRQGSEQDASDKEWCKRKFQGADFQVMEGQDEVEDMNLMASCESIIMANSSFSWWSSFLCPNPSKRVILPVLDKWFTDGVVRVGVPKGWEEIDFNA